MSLLRSFCDKSTHSNWTASRETNLIHSPATQGNRKQTAIHTLEQTNMVREKWTFSRPIPFCKNFEDIVSSLPSVLWWSDRSKICMNNSWAPETLPFSHLSSQRRFKQKLNFSIFTSVLSSASSISGAPGGNNKNPGASSGKASKSCCAPLALRPLERNNACRNSNPLN